MEEPAPGGSLQRAESLPFLPNSPKTPAGREQSLKNDECRGLKVKSSPAGSRGAKVPVPAPCCHRRFRFSQLGVTCGAAAAFGPTGRLCRSPAGAEAEPQHPARCWRHGQRLSLPPPAWFCSTGVQDCVFVPLAAHVPGCKGGVAVSSIAPGLCEARQHPWVPPWHAQHRGWCWSYLGSCCQLCSSLSMVTPAQRCPGGLGG